MVARAPRPARALCAKQASVQCVEALARGLSRLTPQGRTQHSRTICVKALRILQVLRARAQAAASTAGQTQAAAVSTSATNCHLSRTRLALQQLVVPAVRATRQRFDTLATHAAAQYLPAATKDMRMRFGDHDRPQRSRWSLAVHRGGRRPQIPRSCMTSNVRVEPLAHAAGHACPLDTVHYRTTPSIGTLRQCSRSAPQAYGTVRCTAVHRVGASQQSVGTPHKGEPRTTSDRLPKSLTTESEPIFCSCVPVFSTLLSLSVPLAPNCMLVWHLQPATIGDHKPARPR